MKHLKKLLAIAIAVLMILPVGKGIQVNAADYDETLTITGLTQNDEVNFYKVVEWVGPQTDGSDCAGWKAIAPFDTILTKAKLVEILVGDTSADPVVQPTGITAEIAGQLARLVGSQSVAATATETADASGKVEFDVTADSDPDTAGEQPYGPGIYMAVITPAEIDTVYNPVFVSSDYTKENPGEWAVDEAATYGDTAAAKKSTPDLTKTAATTEETYQDGKWNSTKIGETVNYTVTTEIPGYGKVYDVPHFVLKDKMTALQVKIETVTVTEPAGLTKGTEYTVEPDGNGYKLTFEPSYLKTLAVPTAVTVTYDALVTTDAALHVNTEKNEISLEYSHDPTHETDYKYKRDTTQHYTFTIDAEGLGGWTEQQQKKTSEVVKVGVDAAGNPVTKTTEHSQISPAQEWESPLADAIFKLYTDAACTTEYVPLKTDGTADSPLVIKSGADGRMTIKGLDAGTYYLKEESAPAGFIKPASPNDVARIDIAMTTTEVELTEYTTDGVTWISQDDYDALSDAEKAAYKSYKFKTDVLATYTVKINGENTATYKFTNEGTDVFISTEEAPVELPHQFVNTQGTELPNTGGIGTTLFYIIGAIMVVGAGTILVSRKRMAE